MTTDSMPSESPEPPVSSGPSRRYVLLASIGFIIVGGLLAVVGRSVLHQVTGVLGVGLGAAGLGALVLRRPPTATPVPSVRPTAEFSTAEFSPAAAPAAPVQPLPESERRHALQHLDVLRAAGVLASDEPDVGGLLDRLAEEGGHADLDSLLLVMREAGQYRRLAFLESQVEQDEDAVRDQVAELARISDAPIVLDEVAVQCTEARRVQVRGRLTVAGRPVSLDYPSASKYLSMQLPIMLAKEVRAAVAIRLAGLDSGDGDLHVAALPPNADLEPLNSDLLSDTTWRGTDDVWFWLDEAQPD